MAMIFDSHAHYDDTQFDEDREELLRSLPSRGVGAVMNASYSLASSAKSVALTREYDFFRASVGIHPEEAAEFTPAALPLLADYCNDPKVVALGEIGLDYHYDSPSPAVQRTAFLEQLALAKDLDIPVVIHSRDAAQETFDILKAHRPAGVVHCYSGSAELAKEYVQLGMYIGFTGVVTFHNAKKALQAVEAIPLSRLLIETDCPYMAPVPYRGKRCDSTMLSEVAAAIAAVKGISAEEVIAATWENAMTLYRITAL